MTFMTIIDMRKTMYIFFMVSGVECFETGKCSKEDR